MLQHAEDHTLTVPLKGSPVIRSYKLEYNQISTVSTLVCFIDGGDVDVARTSNNSLSTAIDWAVGYLAKHGMVGAGT